MRPSTRLLHDRSIRQARFPDRGDLQGGVIVIPPTGGDVILPQRVMSAARPTVTGATYTPTSFSELQSAVNAAQSGDEIVLQAGMTYPGWLKLPARTGYSPGQYVVIRTSAENFLPDPGPTGISSNLVSNQPRTYPQRDLDKYATIQAPGNDPALDSLPGTSGWYLRGIRFTSVDTSTPNYGTVYVGPGRNIGASSVDDLGREFIFQQCCFTNDWLTTRNYKHMRIGADYVAVVNCHFYGGGMDSGDANSIWIHRCRGPILLHNNFLCHNGENVLSGGAALPAWMTDMPADVQVFCNRVWKDRRWFANHPSYIGPYFGATGGIKNSFEVKEGLRWHFLGNVFDGSTAQGQSGQGLTIKAVNQDGATNWIETGHILIDRCLHKNVGDGFYISALENENGGTGVPVHHVRAVDCAWFMPGDGIFQGTGRGLYFAHRDNDAYYDIDHCTIMHAPTSGHYMFVGGGGTMRNSKVRNTIFGTRSVYGFWGYDASIGQGNNMFNSEFGPTGLVTNNVLSRKDNTEGGAMASKYTWPGQVHYFPADNAAMGLNSDGTLAAGSPCLAGGAYATTDGKDQGVDWPALNAAIAGVEIPEELGGYGT